MRNRSWPAMPYPGLRPFDISADRDESVIFFGRKKQIYELIDRLATSHFIAVLGPSGCGKSSLIRAGVIPDLELGYLQRAGARWTSIVMEPGGHPLRALAISLQKALVEVVPDGKIPDQFTSEEIEQRLKHRPDALVTFFEDPEIAAVFGPDRNVLILVDQFEELFRQDMTSEQDAQHFINLMLNVYHDPPQRLYIILTMRTDFIKQSACYPGLPTVLSRTMCLLDKIDKMGLREAITEPVKLKPYNGEISDDLTKWILDQMDTEGPYDPDLLPLMQHALLWGWQQTVHKTHPATEDKAQSEIKEKTVLKKEDFSAFTGLADCLSKHADAIFNGLTSEQQQIAEVMFRLLCDAMPDGTKIRRVTSVDEIVAVAACRNPEDVRTVIDAFMSNGAGFIRWKDEGKKLDVSHESFIRKWNRFNVWADREANKAKKYIELQSRAYHRQETGLLNRLQCEYYSNWGKETKPTGAWAKRYRYLPIIKKEYSCLVSESKIEIDYLDVQAYLEDSKLAFTRTYLVIFIFVVVLFVLTIIALLFWSSMKSLEAEDHLKKAEEILSNGTAIDENHYKSNLKEMIKNAEQSLKIDNEFPISCLSEDAKKRMRMEDRPAKCHIVKTKAFFFMAKMERSLDNYEKNILESLNKAKYTKNREVYSLLVDMVKFHLDSGAADKVKKAKDIYKILIDDRITDTSLYADIGVSFLSKGFYEEASEIYKYIDSIDGGKDFEILMGLGAFYCQTREYPKAIEKLTEAQKMVDNNPIVQIRLSEVYFNLDDRENAVACLEKVKDDPSACPNLINEYLKAAQERLPKGDKSSAYKYLLKIKDLSCLAYEPAYYLRKGQLLMAIQEPEALDYAINAFVEAIKIQEQVRSPDSETYFMLASAYAQKEEYPKAIEFYSKAVNINKSDFRSYRGLAFCLKKIGKYTEAKEKLNESENIEPWKPLVSDTSERKISTPR